MAYKIGWFSTGRDEAARDLLTTAYEAIQKGQIKGEIAFVFCNRERGEGEESDRFIDLVRSYGLDLVCFSSRTFQPKMRREGLRESKRLGRDSDTLREWRILYDREVMKRLDAYGADLNVLSGYMLVLGDEMCRKYDVINLHPAAPGGPKGTWQEVIWQLIEQRATSTGVMMHLVTEALDEGPLIAYCIFPIRGGDFDPLWADMERKLATKSLAQIAREEGENEPLFREIRRRGVIRELPLIVQTVAAFADGRIQIENRQVIAEGKVQDRGYDLTAEIDRIVETNRE